jgi:hypothetical protein
MDTAFDFESGLTSKRHFSLFQWEFKPIETTSRALVVVFASVNIAYWSKRSGELHLGFKHCQGCTYWTRKDINIFLFFSSEEGS